MKNHSAIAVLTVIVAFAGQCLAQATHAKNVIIFMGDGTGVSSLNAASIYGYNKPQSLYIQSFPGVALADTSTATQWVTDGGAGASAIATGVKTNNGVLSESSSAIKDQKDGAILKNYFEYAREHGLSTGAVSNDERQGFTNALTAAFFAHNNNRAKSGEIFEEMIEPRNGGTGIDVAYSGGRKDVLKQITVMLSEDMDMPLRPTVMDAIARLSKNPKGFVLVVFSDCHTGKAGTSLKRIVEMDNIVREVAATHKDDTLLLWTADHSYDLRIKGEGLQETLKKNEGKKITQIISLEDEHTSEEVPVMAIGPGSERVHGFISNTDVFHILMAAPGWQESTQSATGGTQ